MNNLSEEQINGPRCTEMQEIMAGKVTFFIGFNPRWIMPALWNEMAWMKPHCTIHIVNMYWSTLYADNEWFTLMMKLINTVHSNIDARKICVDQFNPDQLQLHQDTHTGRW